MRAGIIVLALLLCSCGESAPTPPAKRTSTDDIAKAMARLIPGTKPASKSAPLPKPAPEPTPVSAPDPPPVVADSPVKQSAAAKATAVKLKSAKQWERRKAKNGAIGVPGVSVRGHACWKLRLLGSPEAVVAEARKRTKRAVPAAYRRLIYACF